LKLKLEIGLSHQLLLVFRDIGTEYHEALKVERLIREYMRQRDEDYSNSLDDDEPKYDL